jgi:predicted porin
MGYFLAPYDDIHPIFGNVPTLTTSILSTAALWAQGSQGNNDGGFDNRNPNSIRYDSPRIGGFTGAFQLSTLDASPETGAGAGTGSGGSPAQRSRHAYIGSAGGFYANGPFQAGVAYEWREKVRANDLSDWALSVAANWNFGPVKIGGVYERLDYDTPGGTNLKRNFWGVSATAPIGPGELYAFYGDAGDGSGSAPDGTRVGQLIKGNSTGAAQWEISYTYALSKRSLLYTGFVQTRNDNNAPYNFNINPYTVVPGANANGFVVGMVHFF